MHTHGLFFPRAHANRLAPRSRECYNLGVAIPKGPKRSGYTQITREKRALMTPEQIAKENENRAPSEKIAQNPTCGARKERVDAKTGEESKWDTCQQPAGGGTSHPGFGRCKFHGGNTASGRKFAARLAGREYIERQKARMVRFGGDGSTLDITEEEALLEEVRRSVAMVRFLEERIGQWTDSGDSTLGGLPALVDESTKGTPGVTDHQAWLVLYREERTHMAKVAKMAIDSGLNARLVRIAEDQGRMLATAVRNVLNALNLTPDQAALVPKVVPDILRQVATATPMPALVQGGGA